MMIPRLAPDFLFPPYAHVPGQTPHPFSDPAGHRLGSQDFPLGPLDPDNWTDCKLYLFGLDLFNHGYYWEAHEAWEKLWHGCGRRGTTAEFLKGLIHLAAGCLKIREGKPAGVVSHSRRARQLLEKTPSPTFLGLATEELLRLADVLEKSTGSIPSLNPFQLCPQS